jgi:hypothetical protein
MNETADYLDHFGKRTADVVTATIEARNDDDSYMCRTIGSRALLRAAKANPVDEFALGSRVLVSQPAATRNAIGAQPVILSRAPREQRGLSGSTPADTEDQIRRPSLRSVDPDPLVLIAGGADASQVFNGSGFTAGATYDGHGDTPAPTIVEMNAPSVTSTRVIEQIRAGGMSAVGSFDALVAGIRAPDALTVSRFYPKGMIFYPGARIYGIWADYGTVLRQSAILAHAADRTFGVDPDTLIAFYAIGGAAKTTPKLLTLTDYPAPAFPHPNEFGQVVYDGVDSLWYGSGHTLYKVAIADGTATAIHTAADDYEGVAYDSTNDTIFASSKDVRDVRRYARASGALTGTIHCGAVISQPTWLVYPRNLYVYGANLLIFGAEPLEPGHTTNATYNASTLVQVGGAGGSVGTEWPVGIIFPWGDRIVYVVRRRNTSTIPYDFDPNGGSQFRVSRGTAIANASPFTGGSTFGGTGKLYGGGDLRDGRLVVIGEYFGTGVLAFAIYKEVAGVLTFDRVARSPDLLVSAARPSAIMVP